MYERFTDRARKLMQLANQEAQRFNHQYIGTEHMLLALIKGGSGTGLEVLERLGIDGTRVIQEVEKIVQAGPDMIMTGKMPQTPRAKKVIEHSIEEARSLGHDYVGTEHLLLGLMRETEGVAAQVLMGLGATLDRVRQEVKNQGGRPPQDEARPPRIKTPCLDSFGADLTALAARGYLDPVIGREQEIERTLQVLLGRSRRHPVLVGEPGVGKESVVRGLAQRVAEGRVPFLGRTLRLVSVSVARMALDAGGEDHPAAFSRRMLECFEEARSLPSAVLYLDGLLGLTAPAGRSDALDACVVLLAGQPLSCILSGTPDEYRACLRRHPSLAASFEEIPVRPPSQEETLAILRGLLDRLWAHHRVTFSDEALTAAVSLSDAHLPGTQPDKAINVIDQAAALLRLRSAPPPPDFQELDAEIERLSEEKERGVAEHDFERAAHLRDQADKLKKKKAELLRAWQKKAREVTGIVEEDLVAEVVRRMAAPRLDSF